MASEKKVSRKFSLMELIMIILVVGVAMTIIIPLHQAKLREGWTKSAVATMQQITEQDIAYKKANGHFAGAIDSLQVETKSDYFTFSVSGETVIATTTKAFGAENVEILYELPTGPWHRNAKNEKDNFVIQPNWLPE